MSKHSSAKYYQTNKERLQNERHQSLSKKEKEKSDSLVVKDTKIYEKMKNKSLLSIKKIL